MIENKINLPRIEFSRRFLLDRLPEPLTRLSEHLQFFDNYLTATRLFLRQIRSPQTKSWQRFFIQKYPVSDSDASANYLAEIALSEYEYQVLEIFEANELRYNRYFLDFAGRELTIDLHLGNLWGLIIATALFDSAEETENFVPPDFVFKEITADKMFTGEILADLKFTDIQKALGSETG